MAIVPASQQADWTVCGVSGGIPTRTTINATIAAATYGDDSTAAKTAIQNAINACTAGQVVYIPSGIYRVSGVMNMIDSITVRGAGDYCMSRTSFTIGTGSKAFTVPAGIDYIAGTQVLIRKSRNTGLEYDDNFSMQGSVTSYSGTTLTVNVTATVGSGTFSDWVCTITMIKQVGTGAATFNFGTTVSYGYQSPNMVAISSGATAGSTSIVVASAAGISVGHFFVISELNDSEVSITSRANTPQNATWVDGWTDSGFNGLGTRARGQIVKVTNVAGTTLTISPALYRAYVNTPTILKFTAQRSLAGVESLMVYSTNSGCDRNFFMQNASNCWVYDCTCDFTDGDHITMDWCYQCEIRKVYCKDAYIHQAGTYDTQIGFRYKSSCCLVHDCICWRLHTSIILEWGASGNVISYSYCDGEYADTGGSGPPTTNTWLCSSMVGDHGAHPQFNLIEHCVSRHVVIDSFWGTSSDTTVLGGWYFGHGTTHSPYSARTGTDSGSVTLTQELQCFEVWEGQLRASCVGAILGDSTMSAGTYKVVTPTARSYTGKYMVTVGYTSSTDTGATSPLLLDPSTSLILHVNYDFVNATQTWDAGIADHAIPNSYYLAGTPSWFGTLAYPPYNPASPGTPSIQSIPAGYRFATGEEVPTTATAARGLGFILNPH